MATFISSAGQRASSSAAIQVSAFLATAFRRVAWIAAVRGASAGLALSLLNAVAIWWLRGPIAAALGVGAAFIILGAVAGLVIASRNRRRIANLVERRAPECRNLVVTAAELIESPQRVRPEIGGLVLKQATRTVGTLDVEKLFPSQRALAALAATATLWAITLVFVARRPALPVPERRALVSVAALAINAVDVTITPPAYVGGAAVVLRDPARIEALAGSRVRIAVNATASSVRVETIEGQQAVTPTGSASFASEIVVQSDGFVAIEPVASDGKPGVRRLVGLSVTPDRAPRARITAPGRDLFLPDAQRTLAIAVEADDDIALASLRLRYTKVSGSGERFTFIDGETPLTVTRTDARTWTARGSLALSSLGLEQGDVVVYRAVASDRRPGAPPTESDAFIVEITSPGAIASEGFAVDDELDRNAVSQQMVILKTERLLAARASMSQNAFAEQALAIAAEQRQVRAEFVFMMGGELAQEVTGGEAGITELNEEEEAESSDDILAGRLANRGRVEIVRAIRSMSDAASRLVDAEVDSALVDEKLALDHLQRAFSRTRYILRALTQRERLDVTRRLTGALNEAGRDVRPVAEAESDPRVAALRASLAGIAELAGTARFDAATAARVSEVAERVLRVDPSSEQLRGVSVQLADAATAIGRGRSADARALLDRAALGLGSLVRAELVSAPAPRATGAAGRLDGVLTDALRRGGGGR